MRSPEAPAQLHPSIRATYYCNTPHLLFSWLLSTSILKGPQPRCYFDSFQEPKKHGGGGGAGEKREGEKDNHLPNKLVSKTQVYAQSPVSALTRVCALTQIFLEYHDVEVMIYLTALSFYVEAVLSPSLKRRVCCFSSQRLSQINATS